MLSKTGFQVSEIRPISAQFRIERQRHLLYQDFQSPLSALVSVELMNALQSPIQPLQPVRKPRSSQQKKRHHHRAIAIETSIKLGVNLALSSVAIAALGQLLPYSLVQHSKLREVKAEVKATEGRVGHVKAEFRRYFDPHQAKVIVQEQTNRADPSQRQIVWGEATSETAAQLP